MIRDAKSLVIIATYNGEKYLMEAIDSIPKECDLFISDDSSTDSTVPLLSSLKNRNVKVINYSSGGKPALNFANAINNASNEYEYYFLADQDDVWTQDKFSTLTSEIKDLEVIHGQGCPILIFGDSIVVDESLNVINESFFDYDGLAENITQNSNLNIFFQNIAQGATMVFNRSLLEAIRPISGSIYMHDWWILLYASNFGKVKKSNYKTLLYRQHGNNNIGANKRNFFEQICNQVKGKGKVKNHLEKISLQNLNFEKQYGDILSKDVQEFLLNYRLIKKQSFLSRKLFLIKNKIWLSNLKRSLALYFCF
ncbi:glycosyltransferase [Lelliottia amnigena]|uniref:glycosyltransferase n=1 Tax=Lelliottia amnigena TaxID=61646 RepID=UPI0040568AF5